MWSSFLLMHNITLYTLIAFSIVGGIYFLFLTYPAHATSTQNETRPITIEVDDYPHSLDTDPDNNRIYVANLFSDTVSVIDGNTNTVLTNVTVGDYPEALAVNQKTNTIYVVNRDKNVSVIDGNTNTVLTNVTVGDYPLGIAVNPNTNMIFVTSHNYTSVISGYTNQVIGSIPLTGDEIAIDSTRNIVYIATNIPSKIEIIDGNNMSKRPKNVSVASSPADIAVDLVTNKAYVINNDGNRISIIDPTTEAATTVMVDDRPPPSSIAESTLALNPARGILYISTEGRNSISVINSSSGSVIGLVHLPDDIKWPSEIFFSPITNLLYVTDRFSATISVVNVTNSNIMNRDKVSSLEDSLGITTTGFKVSNNPIAVSLNPFTKKMYVGYEASNKISVYDMNTDTLIKNVFVGKGMKKIAVNPDTNKIYVANQAAGNNISIIDGDSDIVVDSVNLGNEIPFDLAVDPNGNLVYATSSSSNKIFFIEGNEDQVLDNSTVGNRSNIITFNPNRDTLYSMSQGWTYDAGGTGQTFGWDNNTLYVLGGLFSVDNTVQVMNQPFDIAVNPNTDLVYVSGDNMLSVIDIYTNNLVTNITGFGDRPTLSVNPVTNMIYVANDNDTVFVVNGLSNKVSETIHTSPFPWRNQQHDVDVDPETNLLYLTNVFDNTVSIINGSSNTLLVGMRFGTEPLDSGYILCKNRTMPDNQYIRIENSTRCVAQAFDGFTFSSWSGDLSSSLANKSSPSLNAFGYGDLTANFQPVPAKVSITLPNQFYETLFLGVVLPSIAGWSIPFFVDRYSSKKKRKVFKQNLEDIESIYNNGVPGDRLRLLEEKKEEITRRLKEGKIDDAFYNILMERISNYVDGLDSSNR